MKKLTPKQLKENIEAKTEQKEEPHVPKPFYEVIYEGDKIASVWDTHLHVAVMKSIGKKATFAISRGKQGYISIEDIVEIAGVRFARDPITKDSLPADILAATERAIKNMDEGKTPGGDPLPENLLSATGLVDVFKATSPDGKPLLTTDRRKYVYIDLAKEGVEQRTRFYCVNESLFECLKIAEFEAIELSYSVLKQASAGEAFTIEDVKRIGNQPFRNGKPA
jgi:hypothetical protein